MPAAVWEITTRGEFYSAYTPYQAEASQGTLQLLYEYQTMICGLTGMEVSNASMYDGASALGEALLMAVRANKQNGSGLALVPRAVNPLYRDVVAATTPAQGIERSEEHTSELQSLMRISYAVFCLKKKKNNEQYHNRMQQN